MKPTQADLFRPYDAFSDTLQRTVKQEFLRLSLAGWDQLNVIGARRHVEKIFNRIDRLCRRVYAELCEWVYEWVYVIYGKDPPDKDWTKVVDDWLRGYDPVTRYVYVNELERKELRLVEGILTARETNDRKMLEEVVRTAAGLILTQGLQYGLDIMGETELAAFEEVVAEKLMYHACDDDRVCKECHDDDGKVFPVDEAPRIPRHYRCRCWYTPVQGG